MGVFRLWMYLEFRRCACVLATYSLAARSAMSSLYSFLDVEILRVASLVESALCHHVGRCPVTEISHGTDGKGGDGDVCKYGTMCYVLTNLYVPNLAWPCHRYPPPRHVRPGRCLSTSSVLLPGCRPGDASCAGYRDTIRRCRLVAPLRS